MNLDNILEMDRNDPLAHKRDLFVLPDGLIYLDGNSLGALPIAARTMAADAVERQWGHDLIRSWNSNHWIDLPVTVGEKIAPLLGAGPGQTICCDSISINLFKLLAAALKMQPDRHVVLSQNDNFPADLYIAQGLRDLCGPETCELKLVEDDDIEAALDETIAVLMLTHVNYRSGRMHDMQSLTRRAHDIGILVIWDLAHSAGALPLQLDDWGVDFAVGCGYKYLNGDASPGKHPATTQRLDGTQGAVCIRTGIPAGTWHAAISWWNATDSLDGRAGCSTRCVRRTGYAGSAGEIHQAGGIISAARGFGRQPCRSGTLISQGEC